jgi:NhaP-type Na+/H+ and K+/H+ antiporter
VFACVNFQPNINWLASWRVRNRVLQSAARLISFFFNDYSFEYFNGLLIAKRDRTCACIVSHTYKQIRKLWDNQEKTNNSQKTMRMVGKFDADIDRSTSSDTGKLINSVQKTQPTCGGTGSKIGRGFDILCSAKARIRLQYMRG